uniref:Uncharacterized protein n=1 Tax=Romanomermis culicivorax TaxID=13658 RepID=A0A915HWH0_ROMCU
MEIIVTNHGPNEERWARGKWRAKMYKKRRGKSWAKNNHSRGTKCFDVLNLMTYFPDNPLNTLTCKQVKEANSATDHWLASIGNSSVCPGD